MKTIVSYLILLLFSVSISAQTVFEGEINYRNFENNSKSVRSLSKGMAYNGARNVKVLVKGNKLHIIDESMHLNTLLLPDEGYAIVYNDLLKRGLKCSFLGYVQTYMSAYGPKTYTPGQTKNYQVKQLEETKTFNDETCEIHKGQLITSVSGSSNPATTNIEVWCSTKYTVDPVYQYYLYGIDVPGIAMKWTIDYQAKIPFVGKMSSYVASEVKSIIPRAIDDSEMQIPSDYELKETDSAFKMLGIYGDTKKYLKKNKMYPGDADADTEVTYKIEEEWDF